MPEVSVIVPVYNAADALQRCIDSILNQEFKDLELLLIDDGSKDGSPIICDKAAKKDERVRVIHKPNSGVSSTRNQGIDLARGEFIQFLDADDWIPQDSTKMLVRCAREKNADLVVGEFYRVVGDKLSRKGSIETDEVLTKQEYADFMKVSPADYYYGVIWNKLYRRDIMNQYNVRMNPEVSFCEDFIFNLEYVLHCERIAALQVPVYYYVKTDGSLVSQNMNPIRLYNMKTSVYQYYDRFFQNLLDEEEYRNERINIASFMFSAATDEFVNPLDPGTKKVGKEKPGVYFGRDDSLISQAYYLNKVYHQYLHTAAMKNDLELSDMRLFAFVEYQKEVTCHSLKEICDVTGLSEPAVLASGQKLMLKGYIKVNLHHDGVTLKVNKAEQLTHDLELVRSDLHAACFQNFSEEEMKEFISYMNRISDNLKGILS